MRLGWKLPLERLSATSMGMAIQCPEQFRQRYLLRTEEKNFDSRFMGSVDHEMSRRLSEYKKKVGSDGVIGGDEIEVMYRSAWDKILDQDGEPAWVKMEAPKAFETGVKMSKLYYAEVISKDDYVPVAIEERLEFKVPNVPATIVGYADTIMRDVVRERKTTDAKTTKPKPKWRFQGLIYQYAIGLPTQWDIVTRQVTPQLYLARDWPDLYLPVQNKKFIEQMIRDTAYRINDLYTQYGADQPWPTTGIFGDWLCNYCSVGPKFNGTCPAWDTGRKT